MSTTSSPSTGSWRDGVVVAYLDEPPFGIPAPPGDRPAGCDMDLAHRVLEAVGVTDVRYALTTFPDLIPGLLDGRWHMTTPVFVTDDRAEVVAFSRPVWTAADGFIVRRGDAARYTSYEAIARTPGATLAVVRGQVQRGTAVAAGLPVDRIVEHLDQDAAAAAVRDGRADASASTASGNRAYVRRAGDPGLVAVAVTVAEQPNAPHGHVPCGAFALPKGTPDLTAAVDDALDRYLGTPDHLALMAGYGFTEDDLRPVLAPRGRTPRRCGQVSGGPAPPRSVSSAG
jgi:polar amino acid transport system substrate-binding protein